MKSNEVKQIIQSIEELEDKKGAELNSDLIESIFEDVGIDFDYLGKNKNEENESLGDSIIDKVEFNYVLELIEKKYNMSLDRLELLKEIDDKYKNSIKFRGYIFTNLE